MSINTYVIKVASRCNLNCSYCYMYNMGDDTYKQQPKKMTLETIDHFSRKLYSYCLAKERKIVFIAFHGGEPLLAGKEFYRKAVEIIRKNIIDVEIVFTLQTNGTLLTEDWCILLKDLGIQVGISIDGPPEFHDQYRVYHNGKGSFLEVINGVRVRDRIDTGGMISVVNIQIPPGQYYSFFKEMSAKRINLLLPDNHYDNLPFGYDSSTHGTTTPYGDWMVQLYDFWKNDTSGTRPMISFFENIISIICGINKGDELIGSRRNGAITIETNGAIEIVDPLRICENGFTRDVLNVRDNEIQDIENNRIFQIYYNSHTEVSSQCRKCPILKICGSGYLGHRYSREKEFDNPSIYCNDLKKIIGHIQNDIVNEMPIGVSKKLGLTKISYSELLNA